MANSRDLDRAGWVTATIANLAVATCQIGGAKRASREWFDVVQVFRNQAKAVPDHVRRTFLDLAKEHKIPSWALRLFDLREFV